MRRRASPGGAFLLWRVGLSGRIELAPPTSDFRHAKYMPFGAGGALPDRYTSRELKLKGSLG
jgi:hypothetical protein